MKRNDINIRDPFVLAEDGVYYLYGTRAAGFGRRTGGFDVYVSKDLEGWSEPIECCDSEKCGWNTDVNWAPEVHKYGGAYYMFATFSDSLRGTRVLRADSPLGPFLPHSDGSVVPAGWECIDGTLYVEDGTPYVVLCHEHTQILDGTIAYVELSPDLKRCVGEPVTLFSAKEAGGGPIRHDGSVHYVTDGPFLYRTKTGALLLLWSTFLDGKYAECLARFDGGSIRGRVEHLPPLVVNDGGHGMIFRAGDKLYLTYHTPNASGLERPAFLELKDEGDTLARA